MKQAQKIRVTSLKNTTGTHFKINGKTVIRLPGVSISAFVKINEKEKTIYLVTNLSYGGQIFILQKRTNGEYQTGSGWVLLNIISVDIRIWELIEGKPISESSESDSKFGRYIYVIGKSDAGPNQGGIRQLHPVYQPIAKNILDLDFYQSDNVKISKNHGNDLLKMILPEEFEESSKNLSGFKFMY